MNIKKDILVRIYTSEMCSFCTAAKYLLKQRGYDFEEIDIDKVGISREDLFKITGGRTVPQVIINNKPIGGYENLKALDLRGELFN